LPHPNHDGRIYRADSEEGFHLRPNDHVGGVAGSHNVTDIDEVSTSRCRHPEPRGRREGLAATAASGQDGEQHGPYRDSTTGPLSSRRHPPIMIEVRSRWKAAELAFDPFQV
jgi:hypothetical protein